MYLWLAIAIIIIILFKDTIINLLRQNINSTTDETAIQIETLPYKKKDYLFSKAEKSFYEVLSLICEQQNVKIFAKVRLGDLLYIPKNTKERMKYWNKIQSKHVDFVLCENENIKPILVIELDDSSHNKANRKERDNFVDKALEDGGLKIVHIPAQYSYNVNELTEKIKNLITPKEVIEIESKEEVLEVSNESDGV